MNHKIFFLLGGIFRVIYRPGRVIQIFKNFFLDMKYSGRYLGIPLKNANMKSGYTNTTSSEYDVLKKLFSSIKITEKDVLVDVGCGSGRVLGWLAVHYPKNKVLGIEIDPEVAAATKKRMKKYKQVEILTGNAINQVFLKQGTVFYMFYPFKEQPMRQFVDILKTNQQQGIYPPARPLIIYHNCGHLNIFEEDPMWKTEHYGNLNGLPTAVLLADI